MMEGTMTKVETVIVTAEQIHGAKTAAEAAAMWWANTLVDAKQDAGLEGKHADMMAMIAKQNKPEQHEQLLEFREILQARLEDRLLASSWRVTFGVDYHPDHILSSCAEKAGLRLGMSDWPWKTMMWASPTEVSVSYGYGAEVETIWSISS